MDFDDTTHRILAHLKLTDSYLIGPVDFSGLFTQLDKATLSNRKPDSVGVLPGDVVQRLETGGHIRRFAVANKDKIGFRI
jgi:hypothetical protein